MKADGQMSAKRHKSMIETNQQFGAGRVEPEKEKNPQQEIRQSHQPERVNQHEMDIEMGEEKTISFKNRLYTIRYQPENFNDILTTGVKYKPQIRAKVQEYIKRKILFHSELEKYSDGEEDTQDAYFHSANRRILDMEQFDEVYDEAMDKINQNFEIYMGESSGLVMNRISSIDVNIARL